MKISILIIVLLIVLNSTSCGSSEVPADNDISVTITETTATAPEYHIPKREDNSGRSFTILAAGKRRELYDAEQTGEVIDDAVYLRKLDTEEYLGINIQYDERDSGWQVAQEYSALITSAVMSGDNTYDMMTGAITVIPKLAMSGNFQNILDLNIDLGNPWWVANLSDTAAINGKLYSVVGDLSATLYNAAAVVYFNIKLQTANSLPDFYTLVYDGSWTVDAMIAASRGISLDLNNDGIIDRDNDQVAILSHYTPFATMQAAGQIEIIWREGGGIILSKLDERLVKLYEKLSAASADGTMYMKNGDEYEVWAKPFMGDRNLFQISILHTAGLFRDMESDFGILPFPKYDEPQNEYSADVSQSTVLWCVPVTVSDAELTAKVFEVYSHFSREYVIPAYYETSLQEKFSRDTDTKEMLQIIRGSIRLTPDSYLNHCFTTKPFSTLATLVEKNQSPASFFAANESAWQSELESIVEAYR